MSALLRRGFSLFEIRAFVKALFARNPNLWWEEPLSLRKPQIRVRDRRRIGYFSIDNEILDSYPDVGHHGLLVYMVLARHASNDLEECFLSLRTIATKARISKDSVHRGVLELEKASLIAVDRGFKSVSGFTLLEVHKNLSPPATDLSPLATDGKSVLESGNLSQNGGKSVSGAVTNKTNNKTNNKTTPDEKASSVEKVPEKKGLDPRHHIFMDLIKRAHEHFTELPCHLNGPAGQQVKLFLKNFKKIDEMMFRKILENYHRSKDHNPSEQPMFYVSRLANYQGGPLDKFGRPARTAEVMPQDGIEVLNAQRKAAAGQE